MPTPIATSGAGEWGQSLSMPMRISNVTSAMPSGNNIAELISLYLTKECFDTMIVNDGESVMPAMETFAPNLILLDLDASRH